jgi:hypothetical protein
LVTIRATPPGEHVSCTVRRESRTPSLAIMMELSPSPAAETAILK